MATTTNKQRVLSQFFNLLKTRSEVSEQEARPVMEQFIYGILREGATTDQADLAFRSLRERFFDWNEIRVSSPRELEEGMGNLPEGELKAERVISFLQEVFEANFSFDLEPLQKKGVKQAAKSLSNYQAANDFVISWVMQRSLDGHAIPVDSPTLRCVQRLGLIEREEENRETVRTSLEHLVPKARNVQFTDLISQVASTHCWEKTPNCATCQLARDCPSAQEPPAPEVVISARVSRNKPR